jgi:hypothetical protein
MRHVDRQNVARSADVASRAREEKAPRQREVTLGVIVLEPVRVALAVLEAVCVAVEDAVAVAVAVCEPVELGD